jgi:hypothetical protein
MDAIVKGTSDGVKLLIIVGVQDVQDKSWTPLKQQTKDRRETNTPQIVVNSDLDLDRVFWSPRFIFSVGSASVHGLILRYCQIL